ncbi:TIGR03986 family CRISPR-associated RAMP protein [Leptotrichia shahii]|uniref:TIGR03986 family type III CRISPR-associated RAMP protein n=1 Tax=Leptotrichia shahii TaxID=157691 RepID=UPI0028D30B93|nr:TIGR03986 family CRISPR-associated RAMP protein [Leptotrichia shahii]
MGKNNVIPIKQYPYNFVSLGEKVIDSGERKLGRNTGKLKCKLITKSPLFIGGEKREKDGHTLEYFYRKNDSFIIPASSLKGAIRNVIDVMTNSVIRNVEYERLEERLKPSKESIVKYGIIESLPDGDKKGVIKVAHRVKIKKEILTKSPNYDKNGKIYKIYMKKNIENYEKIETEEKYKQLLSRKDAQDKTIVTIWVASERPREVYEKILVKKNEILYRFDKKELEDIEYLIKQRSERDKKNNKDFYYKSRKDRDEKNFFKLKVGDPIIMYQKNKKDNMVHLVFSEIPRVRYEFSPFDLVPTEFHPSDSLDNLSFSERLFGTIGDNTKIDEDKKDKLTALSGRVFFEDAKIINKNPKMINNGKLVTLKPFGEPHPTLVSFYLNRKDYNSNTKEGVYIKGRKFYWHHEDKIEKEFKKFSNSITMNSEEKHNSSLELMDYGNEFEFDIHFENLTAEELGVLIYALELEKGLLHKIGRGKAFGFGSCKIEIKEFLLENKDKYKDFFIEPFEKESKKEEYISKAKEKYVDENRKNIQELKAILSQKNNLDFSKSPFPEENGRTPGKNTLNWFLNKKSKGELVLEEILKISENKN